MFLFNGKKEKKLHIWRWMKRREKCITLAFVGDERICDGYYYANSFKTLFRYLRKPELLETKPEFKPECRLKEKSQIHGTFL